MCEAGLQMAITGSSKSEHILRNNREVQFYYLKVKYVNTLTYHSAITNLLPRRYENQTSIDLISNQGSG